MVWDPAPPIKNPGYVYGTNIPYFIRQLKTKTLLWVRAHKKNSSKRQDYNYSCIIICFVRETSLQLTEKNASNDHNPDKMLRKDHENHPEELGGRRVCNLSPYCVVIKQSAKHGRLVQFHLSLEKLSIFFESAQYPPEELLSTKQKDNVGAVSVNCTLWRYSIDTT